MQLNFNVGQTAPASGASICFPLADYPVEIVKEETKAVNGKPNAGMLNYHLKVLDGPYKGQTQIYRLNLWSDNETAINIARGELSALAIVTDRRAMTDSSHLLGAQLIATIGPQDENPKYSDVKIVKDIHGRSAAEIMAGVAAAAPVQQQPVQQQPIVAAFGPAPGQQPQPPQFPGATLPFGQPAAPAQQFAGPHGPASFPAGGFGGVAPAQPAVAASPFANAQPVQQTAPWQAAK